MVRATIGGAFSGISRQLNIGTNLWLVSFSRTAGICSLSPLPSGMIYGEENSGPKTCWDHFKMAPIATEIQAIPNRGKVSRFLLNFFPVF